MGRTSNARSRLLDAAQRAFWLRGCGGVSVDTLCREAGINKGSFYHFFSSKQAVILETIERHWTQQRERVFEPAFDPSLDGLERIRCFFTLQHAQQAAIFGETGEVPGCPLMNISTELGVLGGEVAESLRRVLDEQAAYVEKALQAALLDGGCTCDVGACARSILSLMAGLLLMARVHKDPALILRGVDSALALARGGSVQAPA